MQGGFLAAQEPPKLFILLLIKFVPTRVSFSFVKFETYSSPPANTVQHVNIFCCLVVFATISTGEVVRGSFP